MTTMRKSEQVAAMKAVRAAEREAQAEAHRESALRLRKHVRALAERIAGGAAITDAERTLVAQVLRTWADSPITAPPAKRGRPSEFHPLVAALEVVTFELFRDKSKTVAEAEVARLFGVSPRAIHNGILPYYAAAVAALLPAAPDAARQRIAEKTRRREAIKTGRKSTE